MSENKYGNLTFADWLTFCWPMRWRMPFAVSTFWMVFLTAFSPCPLPNHFLVWPWFSFHLALTVTLQTTKEKMHQKNWQICRLTNGIGKRWITISMLVCWGNSSFYPFIIEHFDIKLTGSSTIPPELGISCFSKWTSHLSLLSI